MKALFTLILILWFTSCFGVRYFWVSPTGSNSANGDETHPWQTLRYAGSQAIAGDIITFENGIYYPVDNAGYQLILTTSGTSTAHIVFRARNKWGAIFDGNSNYGKGLMYISGSYIDIEGFEVRNFALSAFDVYSPSNYTTFTELNVHHIGRYCIPDADDNGRDAFYLSQASNVTVQRCLVHDIGRFSPAEGCPTSTVGYQVLDHGVYVNGCTTVTIRNNIFYNMQRGSSAQTYSGENRTTYGFQFYNNTCENGNPYQQWGHVVLWGSVAGGLIANNIFKDHLAYAIRVYPTGYTYSTVVITKNIISGGNGLLMPENPTGVSALNNYTNTNPLFVSESTHDYHLTVNSPAINLGYNTSLYVDFYNQTRVINDIGAVEYVSAVTVYYNTIQSATVTRNNCGVGYTGSQVTYTVPAGSYESTISVADANAYAQADVVANKQAYANLYGYCIAIGSYTGWLKNNHSAILTNAHGQIISK